MSDLTFNMAIRGLNRSVVEKEVGDKIAHQCLVEVDGHGQSEERGIMYDPRKNLSEIADCVAQKKSDESLVAKETHDAVGKIVVPIPFEAAMKGEHHFKLDLKDSDLPLALELTKQQLTELGLNFQANRDDKTIDVNIPHK